MYSTPRSITGIYNRRHFLTLADREWTRSRRYGRPLSLLIFDIDYFKAINDRFGHEVGDQVIVHTTTLVKERKRDTDVLARIGGEEFALLLPETSLPQANDVADRLRANIEHSPLGITYGSVAATVSIGVSAATPAMSEFADLMRAADRAFYDAKHAGRNRVAATQ
jgi:diguanylate cyclase (GGDEF)-like protein